MSLKISVSLKIFFSKLTVVNVSALWVFAEVFNCFVNNTIARDSTVVNSKPILKSSSVPSYIALNVLMNIVNDKVPTNTTAIKHSVTLGYGTLNYDSFSSSTL